MLLIYNNCVPLHLLKKNKTDTNKVVLSMNEKSMHDKSKS